MERQHLVVSRRTGSGMRGFSLLLVSLSIFASGCNFIKKNTYTTQRQSSAIDLNDPGFATFGSRLPVAISWSGGAAQTVSEADGKATVVATLDMAPTKDIFVGFQLGGTATNGKDYSLPSNNLFFKA